MVNPLITYVLFAYNQEKYIREAVAAALSQTYSPLEIILTDDGSSDRTFEIMKEMASAYRGPHKVILNCNQPNLGVGLHVNKAFSLANGEWIVTGAGDDVSDPHRCTKVMALAATTPDAGVIGMGWRDINEEGDEIGCDLLHRYSEERIDRSSDPRWIQSFASGDFGAWGMSVAWRTEMIRACPDLAAHVIQEDEVYSFWAILLGYSIVHSPEIVVSYRRHCGNVSGYVATQDHDTIEKRRTAKARMNLATWRFVAEQLSDPRRSSQNGTSAMSLNWRDIKSAVEFRIKVSEEEAEWWNYSMIRKALKSFFPARKHGRLALRPRELSRILPLPGYIACKKLASRKPWNQTTIMGNR
jgi:glycosyltransferase involved in cell wall biosynthesis